MMIPWVPFYLIKLRVFGHSLGDVTALMSCDLKKKKIAYWTELLCLEKMHLQSEASRPQYMGWKGEDIFITRDDV